VEVASRRSFWRLLVAVLLVAGCSLTADFGSFDRDTDTPAGPDADVHDVAIGDAEPEVDAGNPCPANNTVVVCETFDDGRWPAGWTARTSMGRASLDSTLFASRPFSLRLEKDGADAAAERSFMYVRAFVWPTEYARASLRLFHRYEPSATDREIAAFSGDSWQLLLDPARVEIQLPNISFYDRRLLDVRAEPNAWHTYELTVNSKQATVLVDGHLAAALPLPFVFPVVLHEPVSVSIGSIAPSPDSTVRANWDDVVLDVQ
jgi:hypothetical protein